MNHGERDISNVFRHIERRMLTLVSSNQCYTSQCVLDELPEHKVCLAMTRDGEMLSLQIATVRQSAGEWCSERAFDHVAHRQTRVMWRASKRNERWPIQQLAPLPTGRYLLPGTMRTLRRRADGHGIRATSQDSVCLAVIGLFSIGHLRNTAQQSANRQPGHVTPADNSNDTMLRIVDDYPKWPKKGAVIASGTECLS